MNYIVLALFSTGVFIPILIVVHLVIKLIVIGNSQVLLCMECDKCVKVCPILKKCPNAASPKEIMKAVKVGNLDKLEEMGMLLCNSCGACEKACPRGLTPYKEVEKLKAKSPETKKKKVYEDINFETPTVQFKS